MNSSKIQLSSLVDILPNFLKTFDKAKKCLQIPLTKTKIEIESTKSEGNFFSHYCKDVIGHPNRQTLLSLRFETNDSCVSSIKKFELHGKKFILTKIVNFNHRKIRHLYKNQNYVSNKSEIMESNYDV